MLRRILVALSALVIAVTCQLERPVDYSGHKVLTVYPTCNQHLDILHNLRKDYGVDLWNEPRVKNVPVMLRLSPDLAGAVMRVLKQYGMRYETAIEDVQRAIVAERTQNAPTNHTLSSTSTFDHGRYNEYDKIVTFLTGLPTEYPDLITLETIGQTYENRPIYAIKVSTGGSETKPTILTDCGIHAREWTSVSACLCGLHKLGEQYKAGNPDVLRLLKAYTLYMIPVANPDGYMYTWTHDRLWRKTRSRSSIDWLGVCRGADANRNFDIEHCGVGTSRKPCDDIYCGDAPFSESETRAIRDLMIKLGSNLKALFSIHAFSQLWMTPYGIKKSLPPDYAELERIGKVGAEALKRKHGTIYKVGSIANIIYEAAGSSVDYAYVKQDIKLAFALELRDQGRFGFFLPQNQMLPTCEETFEGVLAAINAMK